MHSVWRRRELTVLSALFLQYKRPEAGMWFRGGVFSDGL
jgi:hypothetical protein